MKRCVIVGVGGVGTHLDEPLCRYLAATYPGAAEVVLADGDVFEPKNRSRQNFDQRLADELYNKADTRATELAAKFPEIVVTPFPAFVNSANAASVVREGDVVFVAVDNHTSRKLLDEHASTLRNVTLISGGNDYHDGNAQVHQRRDGVDVTAPITYAHPEIAYPEPHDKHPDDMSCEDKARAGSPQLIFANLKVASLMLDGFWTAEEKGRGGPAIDIPPWSEVYFDISHGTQRPIKRSMRNNGTGSEAEDRDQPAGLGPVGGRAEAAS